MFQTTSFSNQPLAYEKPLTSFMKEQCFSLQAPKRVLCLGENKENLAIFLAQKGLVVDVLEVDETNHFTIHKQIKEPFLPVRLEHTTLSRWHADNVFDRIFCSFLYLEKEQQALLFEKCFSALKMGGVLVVEALSESHKSLEPKAFKEPNQLYNFNETLRIFKTLPFVLEKFSQEVITLKDENFFEKRASVVHIIALKNS